MRSAPSKAYQRTLRQLYRLGQFGVKLGLENISALLDDLGDPHNAFPSIHIAGSNGKGSVAVLLATALQAAGNRVGLYTSPHLVDFRERIRIDGECISRRNVIGLWDRLRPRVRQLKATYFETVTAMAFEYFRSRNVDIAVVETGLGGRLDATNVLLPHAAVITNISREHTRWLGKRLEQIAREKGGIIKEGVPVICAETKKTPCKVIDRICRRRKASLHRVDEELRWEVEEASLDGSDLFVWVDGQGYGSLYLGLPGTHQVRNAMTALLTLLVLGNIGWEVPLRAIRTGFALAQWPGRLQVVQHDPLVLMDVAHNPDGCRNLKEAIREYIPGRKVSFVFGVQEDKEVQAMIRHLAPVAERFYLTRASWKGAADPKTLARAVKERGLDCLTYPRVHRALRAAIGSPEEIVCVTGSHYVVGEAMEELGIQP
jgi:dihydrofolate synthase/folylpolyglutamate synthase